MGCGVPSHYCGWGWGWALTWSECTPLPAIGHVSDLVPVVPARSAPCGTPSIRNVSPAVGYARARPCAASAWPLARGSAASAAPRIDPYSAVALLWRL
jgi:hypothetical protein